ncbi:MULTISPECIES: Mur ligase family protein [Brachybacterium]|uniref:Mur ligase family protein n=1 Tax=Brachybacterium TaxID=43668 RepID=UPI0013DFE264|nr:MULTISPECIES: Mur ligase family protein [Brachybacterium]
MRPAQFRRSAQFLPDLLAEQVVLGEEAITLEAFVGTLKDGLYEHVEVDVAVCTGLESDHLEVHGSLEAYWGAKLQLFEEHLRPDGAVVLATDCAQGELVRDAAARRGARLVTVGPGGDVVLEEVEEVAAADGAMRLEGVLRVGSQRLPVLLPTVHAVAVTNLLLAASAVIALGAGPGTVAEALAGVAPPPGRLEVIGRRGGVTAMVDTAHSGRRTIPLASTKNPAGPETSGVILWS